MELSRSSLKVDQTWKLCIIGSLLGFFMVTLTINHIIGNPFSSSSATISAGGTSLSLSSSNCACSNSTTQQQQQLKCSTNSSSSDSSNSTLIGNNSSYNTGKQVKSSLSSLPTPSINSNSSRNSIDIESDYSESGVDSRIEESSSSVNIDDSSYNSSGSGTQVKLSPNSPESVVLPLMEDSTSNNDEDRSGMEDDSATNLSISSSTTEEFNNPSSLPEATAAGFVDTEDKDEEEKDDLLNKKKEKKRTIGSGNNVDEKTCDIFDGKWVFKPEQKLPYDKGSCPFIEEKMSCIRNGRPDSDFEKWSWEPTNCHIPMFNGTDMLERLRGKRVILVGDSLNRNQWESLACLLYTSIPSSRAHVDSKSDVYKVFRAMDYDCVVEFHWSPFIVLMDLNHPSSSKVVLDKLPPSSQKWKGADVMIFNSGHWWTHIGKFRRWRYFEYENELVEEMQTEVAYERALQTWSKWIDQNVDSNKTTVYFRTISSEHKRDNWCFNMTQPISDVQSSYTQLYPQSMIDVVDKKIGDMVTPVRYLNVTKLSSYRIDAHPSVYRTRNWRLYTTKYRRLIYNMCDCSHWCLPGVPDTWNRLLYASLFFDPSVHSSARL